MSQRTNMGHLVDPVLSDYVVIDLETTGLNSQENEIIEFGAVAVMNNTIVDSFSQLVKPSAAIDPFITELTGISNEMVADAPCIEEAMEAFLQFVGDSVVLGHNITFDIAFVYDTCMRLWNRPFSNDYMDTLRMARKCYPQERHNRLCDLEVRFGLRNERAHRALSDVLLTKQCYDRMKQFYI